MLQSAAPIYVQIANDLRTKIQQGVYQAGDRLPSQKALGSQLGVNRHTVRQAFELLKDEGLLRVDRGLGAFVADAPIRYPIGKRVRYNESLQAQGLSSHYDLLQASEVPASETVAHHLNIEPAAAVVQVDLLGWAGDRPLIVSTSYFPSEPFPELLSHVQTVRSISQLMKTIYHYDHIRQRTYVSTGMIRLQDAKLLQISMGQAILLVQAINVNQVGQIIEYTVTRFRGDGVELMFDH